MAKSNQIQATKAERWRQLRVCAGNCVKDGASHSHLVAVAAAALQQFNCFKISPGRVRWDFRILIRCKTQ